MTEVNSSRNFIPRRTENPHTYTNNGKLDREAMQFAQLMNGAENTTSNDINCKFKANDRMLAITVDDLDSSPQKMTTLADYLAKENLPVTLFPHKGANPSNIQDMKNRLNEKFGWHGEIRNQLDKNPPSFVDKSVIAWSWGRDGEGKKAEIKGDYNFVARGVLCDREKRIGEFNQHEVSSCTIGHDLRPAIQEKNEEELGRQREKVLKGGGVLSVHLHNSDGLHLLEETVDAFKNNGGKFIHLNQLKGCGVPGK